MESFPPYNEIPQTGSRLNSLLLILIFTLFGSGAALIVLKQIDTYHRDQIYLATQAALPEHKISAAGVTKKNETSDWKTYRNEEYGFEFEFDSSKWVTEIIEHSTEDLGLVVIDKKYGHDGPGIRGVLIDIEAISENNYLKSLLALKEPGDEITQTILKGYDNSSWQLVKISKNQTVGDEPKNIFYVFNQYLNNTYIIIGSTNSEYELALSLISTFKFTK